MRVILGDVLPQTGPYTVTVWLNGVPSATFGSAISKPLDLVTVNDDLSLTISTGGWSFEGTRGGSVASAADMTEVRGAWHHFALLDDRVNRTIYLDGQLKSTAPGPWETSTLPIAIGADLDQGSFSVPFTGTMDDLRFYPRVLDASEIAAVYAERL
ncbi:MAG: LamG domain-containing protein [Deltaproteobacteria bacterium]|nr:LamG domain-containing protein [Deltaproteobacteria bacterium]